MQLNPLDPNGSPWNEGALHALGASAVAWPDLAKGPVVTPDVNLAGYAAAAAASVPAITATKRQVLLQLLTLGKQESDVITAINTIPDATAKAQALIEWNYPDGGLMHRQHPLFNQLATAFGLTAAQITSAFEAAKAL